MYSEAGRVRQENLEQNQPMVQIGQVGNTVLNDSVMISENSQKMCPNCGDTSRLGRKELDEDEARRLGVLEGVPDEEANRIIGRIAKLFKYRTAEMFEGLGGEEGEIHNTIREEGIRAGS